MSADDLATVRAGIESYRRPGVDRDRDQYAAALAALDRLAARLQEAERERDEVRAVLNADGWRQDSDGTWHRVTTAGDARPVLARAEAAEAREAALKEALEDLARHDGLHEPTYRNPAAVARAALAEKPGATG